VSPFIDTLNWVFLFISLSGMALMLRALSMRLGEALRMKKYYFLYDFSVAIFAVSAAIILLNPDGPWPLGARLLFLLGTALMVGVTVRYWGWILPEILKHSK
jgi:hypothetical protein